MEACLCPPPSEMTGQQLKQLLYSYIYAGISWMTYFLFVHLSVDMELIDQVIWQINERAVFLVGALPGEVVSIQVLADLEAAGGVWFNW